MRILLTNDDGIFAPGLAAIYKELVNIGDVTVVAPSQGWSGTGHTVTFNQHLVFNEIEVNEVFSGFSVQGSPADCIKLGVMQLCKSRVDLVVSGINNGANVGINVYYSGTVAAAMEGAFLKIPSVAMSLAAEEQMDYESAARYCFKILKKLIPTKTIEVINVNIPLLSKGKPKGIKVVPQSTEGFHEYYVNQKNEQGQTVYKLAGGSHRSEESQVDTITLAEGFITITALVPDMTDHEKTDELKKTNWQTDIF